MRKMYLFENNGIILNKKWLFCSPSVHVPILLRLKTQ